MIYAWTINPNSLNSWWQPAHQMAGMLSVLVLIGIILVLTVFNWFYEHSLLLLWRSLYVCCKNNFISQPHSKLVRYLNITLISGLSWWLSWYIIYLQCRIHGSERSFGEGNGNTHHGQRIPWTEKPGGLQSKGSQRVGQNWVTNTFTLYWFQLCYFSPLLIFFNFNNWN